MRVALEPVGAEGVKEPATRSGFRCAVRSCARASSNERSAMDSPERTHPEASFAVAGRARRRMLGLAGERRLELFVEASWNEAATRYHEAEPDLMTGEASARFRLMVLPTPLELLPMRSRTRFGLRLPIVGAVRSRGAP